VVVVVVVGMTRDFCLVSKHRAAGYGTGQPKFQRLGGALKLLRSRRTAPAPLFHLHNNIIIIITITVIIILFLF
jgi:hypothetical protein